MSQSSARCGAPQGRNPRPCPVIPALAPPYPAPRPASPGRGLPASAHYQPASPLPTPELGRRVPAAPQEGAGPPGEKDGKITWLERYLGNVSSRGFLLSKRGAPCAARGAQAAAAQGCRGDGVRARVAWRPVLFVKVGAARGRGEQRQGQGGGAWGEGQRASAPPQPAVPRPALGLTVACAVAVFLL